MLTMRSAAFPSQSSGIRSLCSFPFKTEEIANWIPAGWFPTTRLVPPRTVTGRSVFSRRVRHGTPRTVASSCNPPESVIIIRADRFRVIMSRYPMGAVSFTPLLLSIRRRIPRLSKFFRDRGWIGQTIGSSRDRSNMRSTMPRKTSGSNPQRPINVTTPKAP